MPSRRAFLTSGTAIATSVSLTGCNGRTGPVPTLTATSTPTPSPADAEYAPDALYDGVATGAGRSFRLTQNFSLDPNQYAVIVERHPVDGELEFTVEVTSGGPIDVFLLFSEGETTSSIYTSTTEFPQPVVSKTVENRMTLLVEEPGNYQFVIDNSNYGATPPTGPIEGNAMHSVSSPAPYY